MNPLSKRIAALEQSRPSATPRWHSMMRYENETDEQAVAAYEAKNGQIGSDNVIMRIIIDKPGERPDPSVRQSHG